MGILREWGELKVEELASVLIIQDSHLPHCVMIFFLCHVKN